MTRLAARLAATLTSAALLTLGLAGLAAAHVTIHPEQAEQGSYQALTFRVPTERDDASTVKLVVALPIDHPIRSVSIRPHPGWSYQIKYHRFDPARTINGREVTRVVSRITWTADTKQTAIKPGEYDEFSISAGPLPEVDQLAFKTLQYYSTGEIVRWIQATQPGQPEPEDPAPTVTLTAADTTSSSPTPVANAGASTGGGMVMWTPMCLAIAALVVAIGAGGLTWRRRTR